MIYFTSDLHLCHRRILEFEPDRLSWCRDLDSMNRTIIADWYNFKPDDNLFILGDFLFNKNESYYYINELLKPVQCKIFLVEGNHDDRLDRYRLDNINFVGYYQELYYKDVKFCLCHYPMAEWNNEHGSKESVMLHGHLHSKKCDYYHPRLINVGIDSIDTPSRYISADDLIELARKRESVWIPSSKNIVDKIKDK